MISLLYRAPLARFGLVGLLVTAFHLLVFSALEPRVLPELANSAAFVVATQVNFLLSYHFTWSSRREGGREPLARVARRALVFNGSALVAFVVNAAAFAAAFRLVELPSFASAMLATAVSAAVSFVISSRVTFARAPLAAVAGATAPVVPGTPLAGVPAPRTGSGPIGPDPVAEPSEAIAHRRTPGSPEGRVNPLDDTTDTPLPPDTDVVRSAADARGGDPRAVDLDVVVPVWNEEARLGATLEALVAHAATLPLDVMITVVDNGSVDRSAEVVDDLARRLPPGTALRLLGCSRQGKGAAVRRGLLSSHGRWRGFVDADLATPPETLTAMVSHLAEGAPVVIGSRRCEGAELVVSQPLVRRLGGRGFRRLTRPLVGDVTDTQCGFKFFSADAAERIFSRVSSTGFVFDVEVLAVAARLGLPVREVPVRWTDQAGSSFSVWTHGRRVLPEVRAVRASLARMK